MSTEGVDSDVMEILNTFEYVEKIQNSKSQFSLSLFSLRYFLLVKKSGVEVGLARLEHVFSLGSLCVRRKD